MSQRLLGRPPGPQGVPFLGFLREYRRNPAEFLLRIAREFGDIGYFRIGPKHIYLLNRPDFIQEVLVTSQASYVKGHVLQRAKSLLGEGLLTSEGSHHRRQRRFIQPAFHRERIADYAAAMVDCADAAQARWQPGEKRDMAREMMALTLSIVSRTLFSTPIESDAAAVGRAMTDVLGAFDLILLPFSRLIQLLPLPSVLRVRKARKFLDAMIYRIIEKRRKSNQDTGDLLSMLLSARDENGVPSLSDKQVRDEAMTIFLAGHETTANALAWTWYLLSQHPEVEERLREELHSVLGGRRPTADDVPQLRYTEMVFAEAMRLYPPAWAIGRLATRQMRIFNYVVSKGSICVMSPYTMHRHPRFWPDPERFDPERFLPEARESRPKFTYFPFGAGPRSCIGERFAWTEGVLVLATLAQNWRFRLAPDQVIDTLPQITLRPRYGMMMILERP